VEVGVHLTVVSNQVEAEIVCSYLRANGIKCADRAADVPIYGAGGFGGNREILVSRDDLEAARTLLAAKQLKG
jgi:Putative prokaryotic signal transducing protein